jgi:O-antigen ligase
MPTERLKDPSPDGPASLHVALALATLVPTILAYNVPPSATLFNQCAALVGWGVALTWLAAQVRTNETRIAGGLAATLLAFTLCSVSVAASIAWNTPGSLARSNIGMVAAAALAALVAAQSQRDGLGLLASRAFFVGLVVACVASALVALIQVYAPTWPDGNLIAKSGLEGRAVGNMRQPNHLSSLLLWGLIAVAWLGDGPRAWRRGLVWGLALLFVFGVVLSGSRTGALGTGVLTAWALLDRRLSRSTRWLLGLMPLFYLVFWLGNSAWAEYSHHVFGGETRFSTAGDISSSRYGIWSNTFALIKAHPWFGVGFGEFNFAWTLTPFPDRPVAFFDHTHNLPLQLIVEMGLPLGLMVLALLLFALYRALRNVMPQPARDPALPPQAPTAAFMVVLMIGLHSLLEYPLWYAYFLFPTAFAFGLCLGDPPAGQRVAASAPPDNRTRPLLLAAMLMFAAGFFVLYDYMKVVRIFVADESAPSLAERIVEGRRSVFFAHHADYAAATVSSHPSQVMSSFKRAPHYLLDARLMMAWAKALDEAGETDKARYLAQRLKEFRNEQAAEFFAPCEQPIPQADKPFQCQQPSRPLSYEDFR